MKGSFIFMRLLYGRLLVVVSCFCSTQMTTVPTQNKKMIVMSYFVKCGVRQQWCCLSVGRTHR